MRSQEEIQIEIGKLTELKPKIRHFSFFGDNNRNAVQAQIAVLTDDMDETEIYDMEGDWTQHEIDCALEARRWADEEEDELPSSGWEDLVQ